MHCERGLRRWSLATLSACLLTACVSDLKAIPDVTIGADATDDLDATGDATGPDDARTDASSELPSLMPVGPGPGPNADNASMFAGGTVVTFDVDIADADWQTLMADQAAGVKGYVPCTFTFDGETATSAAIRLKSNPEDWEGNKPQFVIKFNEFDASARFRGLRRVVLEANPSDETLIRNNLALALLRAAGVVTPRSNHARLNINGALYGVYEHIEAVDRELLEDRYADADGNLYKNGEELSTNEALGDTSDLLAFDDLIFTDGVTEGGGLDSAHREALTGLIDMDAFILEAAAEAVLPTGDNFWSGGWNYYLYHPKGALWTIIPWDVDDVFGDVAPPDAPLLDWNGLPEVGNVRHPLMAAITADSAWRSAFLAQVARIEADLYRTTLAELATSLCATLRPQLEDDPNRTFELNDFDQDCGAVRAAIDARSVAIRSQLDTLGSRR